MAISNVDDLYNELSSNENFSGLFANPEDFATALEGMSPERRDAFFEKLGASEQISKVDFDNVLKKKENSLSNLQLDGDNQPTKANTPQPKPSIPNQTQPQGNTQSNRIEPPRITLFPDEPAPGSPVKRKTLEERFPQTEEEKKKQKQLEAVQTVMKEQEKQKNVYTPPKKPTPEQVKQNIALQKQFDREQKNVSDMPTIKSIDYEAVAAGRQFVKQQDELASQKKAEEIKVAKDSDNSLFSGLQKGLYEYALPSGEKFQLDEYAIGRALFENQPIEIFSKSGVKVDVLDPTKDLLKGDNNFNVIDDQTIRDHFSRLGFSEEQSDEEILRLKQLYLQQGAKDASKNLYNQLLQKWNGNQALANQNYLNYWNNRGLDLLEGSEKEAYHIVKQMEAIRSKLIQEQKKGGLSAYNASTVQSYRKQLDDLQDQLSELRDNPNNLYDWRTGEFIDTRIKKGDPRVAEIQQENKEFQAKYGDKPKEALVKRRDELLSERAFIMNKMREFNLDIPEEGTWDSAVRALQLSAARLSGVNTITLPDGRTIDAKMYERKMRDYNSQLYSVMSELYGLNRAVMLNENVALRKESESFLGSVAKNLGIAAESVAREFTPGTTTEDANSEYNLRNSLLNSLEQSGYVIDPSLRSAASASVSETISGSAGMLLSSMAQIALGNIAVPEIMSLRWAKQFKDILSNKYGKLGAAVFENTANAMRSGAIFEAAGQGFSTGVGEYGAQAAFDLLNLDRILGSKGRLANFLYRSLIGGAGETFEEVAGQYIQGLTDAGFDPNKAFKDSFGVTPESRLDQLLVIGITSLGFSGASNLKLLTATRSTLNDILENPKLAAAYGEILTPEKKQQIEDVLKAVDDKLADKQSQQTNAEVTGTESSEYTPRVNGEDVQKQVALINEERKQALEQITPEGGAQTPEQKAEVEQKAAEINALYDERVNAVVPPQTKFDTLTGTNQNAVLGNIDLNSEQAQNFLASLPNARARRNAATLMAVANNANTTLESILPNAKVVLHSRESFRDKMSQVGEQADRKGNFSIIRNPDGSSDIEIQINVEDGNVMDIAHEVTHGVLFSKFYGDDKRMAEIAEIRANTDLTPEQINNQIKEVNNKYDNQFSETLNSFKEQLKDLVTEKGNKYLESFIANYDENAKAEEYLSEFTAILVKNGEQIRQEDPTFFERLLAMINRLVGVIGKEAGIKLQKFEDTQEVIDFFNTVVSSIRKGEALTETKIPKTDAVQKQTAGQVPVQPETRVGQEVEQGKPQAEPQGVTEEGQEEEIINKPRVAIPSIVQVFHGGSLETPRDNVFVATDPEQARAYAQGNQGRLYQFYVDKSTLAGESYVYRKIKELGLSSKEEGQNTDELGIQELLDNRFDTALPDEQIQQLQDKLKEEDFTGISFIDEDILQKQKLGVENYLIFNPDDLYNSEEQANNAIQLKSNKRDGKPNPKDFGSISEDRLSPASGESKLGSMGEDAAYYVQTFQSSEPEEPGERRESKALRQWAKENRVYINEKQLQKVIEKQNLRVLEPGAESDVYLGPESNYVYKISNGGWAKNWKEFFLRIIAHNELFSSTPYEILGFTEKDGDLGVLMKQPAIPFNKGLDQEEVHEYLKDLGFDQDKQKMWSLSGEDTRRGVVLEDLHSGNVVWNELTGEATMIDPFIFFTANSPYRQAIENTIEDNFGKEIINKARRPIEEVKKDLNEKLAKGQVDRVTLSLLEDYGKQLEEGKVIYDRFLEEENSGFVSGGHILAESTLLATRNAGVDESQDERVDRQEAEIEKYAKLKGIWIENTEDFLSEKYGEPIGSGQESIVFGTEKNTVVKTSNTNQYKDHAAALESIVLSNAYFPATAQKVIGFGLDSDGEFQIVTEQQFFPEDQEVTQEEIIEFLTSGNEFEINTKEWSGGNTRFLSENVLLNDAAPKNFIKSNGMLFPIDVIMKFNTVDLGLGGKRVLPETKVGAEAEPLGPPREVINKGRVEPWSTPQQEISSAGTSINKAKLPSVYTDKKFLDLLRGVSGKRVVIADIGSGKYANLNIKPLLEKAEIAEFINESSKKMLSEKAIPALEEVLGGKEVAYYPYDPFNQPASVNEETINNVRNGGADIAVSPNVLNVIAEFDAREGVIANLANAVGNTGTAVIQIYEGDPKDRGVGKETKTAGETSWQNNQPTAWYLPEVQAYFANVKRSGNIIIADNKGQEIVGMPVSGAQKAQIINKARIEEKTKESKAYGIPQRHKGDVGKMIGGDLYVHYSANDVLPQSELVAAENKLPEGFEYEVIKYNAKEGSFSFIASPDWNTSHEPIVGDAYKVKKNGEVSVTKQKENPQIYHHKWNFVRDDYSGFDVEQSIQRSIDWYRDAKSEIEMTKIGSQNYWKENALPLINDTTKIINKGRKDKVDFEIVKDYEDFRRNGYSVDGAYYELEKMNYSPGDIKRYIPEIAEAWRKRSLRKFFSTIRKHQGKIAKRQEKIRQELQNNPGLDFDTLYNMLKDKYEDFELFKAFYEEGANPVDLDKIFGTEYRETIQNAMEETRDGRTVYNKDFLRTLREDARSRKMVNAADQMNNLFGFFNGVIDNEQMIELLADGLEETGLEFSLQAVTDDIRTKRAELENDLDTLKKISKGEVDPNAMINVSRLLSLAGRMLRMGRGLFMNQESFEKAIFDYLENVSYKTEAGGIIRKFKGFKLTYWQKRKISDRIKEFREAKAEYDKEIKLLQESEDAYTDEQFAAFDKAKANFDQSARKLKVTIDAYRKKGLGNWFTSNTALALLSFRTLFIGLIGNLEMQLASLPNNKGKSLLFGWSRRLSNKIVGGITKKTSTELDQMIKRGAMGNVDPSLYRKMAWEQGVQQIKNIFQNTIGSVSTNEDSFFETQVVIDSTKELPLGLQMVGTLIKNIFKKDIDKMDDVEWAEKFDQLLVMMNEKDENGNNKLELMNPKGYQALTTLMRGIFGFVPTAVGKSIALSGDRVFYQLGYYEALASYAYSQGITDPNEVKKFIRLNSVPNALAGDVARREGERRIFANDNAIVDWFAKVRGGVAKAEKNLFGKSVELKKQGRYAQRFGRIYPQKTGLATKKMGLTSFSPFTRIPSNFVSMALEKTLFPVSATMYLIQQRKLNRMVKEYEEKFNVDQNTTLSPTKQREQERMRLDIFEQQRKASRALTSFFQAAQVAMLATLLIQSGAVGAPYGDDEEEKKAARAAGIANQPPGKINVSHLIDYLMNGFDAKGRTYKPGDITFQYTNLGIVGFGLTWLSTLNASIAAKEFEDRKVLGVGEDGYSNVTFNMVAESITNGITSLSFIQNIASLVSSFKTGKEGVENFAVNLAKTVLTVPTAAYGLFGAIEKAEGISADNMRNYYPDLETDSELGSKFKMKLWTSLTGKSPIFLFGLKNTKGEFLSPYASPYYQPQIGPHGEELYKKNTFWDVRSGELSDRVAAYLQASFDPFAFTDYEGFVSTVKQYNPKQTYYPGDIVDDGNFIYAVKKQIPAGTRFKELNLDQQDKDYETITSTSDFFDRTKYKLNKEGSEATTQLYNLLALYQQATGSRKEFQVLNRFFDPYVQGKDAEGEFSIYIPLKYQRELAKLRGEKVLKSYNQQSVQETINRIQRSADEMDDEEFNRYVEDQVENILMGPIDPVNLSRSGGIKTKIDTALEELESDERYRRIKRQAIQEALEGGLFSEEEFNRMKDAEGISSIIADLGNQKWKFRK